MGQRNDPCGDRGELKKKVIERKLLSAAGGELGETL